MLSNYGNKVLFSVIKSFCFVRAETFVQTIITLQVTTFESELRCFLEQLAAIAWTVVIQSGKSCVLRTKTAMKTCDLTYMDTARRRLDSSCLILISFWSLCGHTIHTLVKFLRIPMLSFVTTCWAAIHSLRSQALN